MALTLKAAITATQTTVDIAGSDALSEGDVRSIDSEYVKIRSAAQATLQYGETAYYRATLKRGVQGTAKATHAAAATLTAVLPGGEGGGPQTVYVQPTDPGAVGSGKLWVDTTDPAVFTIRRRNSDDDGWWDALSDYEAVAEIEIRSGPASPLRLRQLDGDGNVRSELLFDQSEGRADINAFDAEGTQIATWNVGEDGIGALVRDELGNVRAAHLAQSGASGDTDAVVEWTIKNTAGTEKAKLTLDETGFHVEAVNVVEVPATPDAQDIVDALLALGLVTQAAP